MLAFLHGGLLRGEGRGEGTAGENFDVKGTHIIMWN